VGGVDEVFVLGPDMKDVGQHTPDELGESQDFAEDGLGA
jgi:hypothetical protein